MAIAPLFTNQLQAFTPAQMPGQETEEERRRRLEQEAQARGEIIPVKQTITTDPTTGEQRMKIEGSVNDLTAANPLTPTVIQPVSPVAPMDTGPTQDELLREQEQRRQYQAMMARPETAAVSPDQMAQGQGPQPVVQFGQPIPEAPRREPAAAAGQQASGGNVFEFGYPQPATPTPTMMAQAAPATRSDVTAGTTGVIAQPTATQPAPATNMQRILDSQNDIRQLMALAGSGTLSPEEERLAQSIIRDQLSMQRQMDTGQQQVNKAIQSGDPREINRIMRDNKQGSIFRAILFGYTGAKDLANEELNKLGYGGQYRNVAIDGEQAYVRTTAQGQPLEGMFLTGPNAGRSLTDTQLMAGISGGPPKFKADVSMQDVEAKIDGKDIKGRVTTKYDSQGNSRTVVESGGREYAYDGRWKPTAISTAAEKAVAQKQISLEFDPKIRTMVTAAEEAVKINNKYGTNVGVIGMDAQNRPIYVDNNTNTVIRTDSQGRAVATTGAAGASGTAGRDVGLAIQQTTGQEFVKANIDNAKVEANKAGQAPGLLRAVDNIVRNAKQRPDFFNSLQTPAYRAFVATQGPEAQARLEDLSNVVRIASKDRPAFQELMNDVKRLELAGITQSGLTASQLNTERESQRVINAFAISMRDTPQAAQIQAEIARATIEYQREFAKYLGRADPATNPAKIRTDFDDRIGDQIWRDLEPKLKAIRDGGVVDFRSKR